VGGGGGGSRHTQAGQTHLGGSDTPRRITHTQAGVRPADMGIAIAQESERERRETTGYEPLDPIVSGSDTWTLHDEQ
jgi:hypothetical protein